MTDTAGTYIVITVRSGGCYLVQRQHEGEIEIAYAKERMARVDTVLSLTQVNGDDVTITASEITEYATSTALGRARSLEMEVQDNERRKHAFGERWDER